jgi:predicted nucleic acid-binding Zn ribbon protein
VPDDAEAGRTAGSAAGSAGSGSGAADPASGAADPASGAADPGSGAAGSAPDVVSAEGGELTGPALARAVLDAAMARRKSGGAGRRTRGRADLDGDSVVGDGTGEAGAGPATGRGGQPRRRPRGYSGPGPDPRDPQLFGAVLARMVKARGWQQPAAEATVFGAWERVVGPDIAQHSRPVKLEDGELTVEAESTAWATQLRLLAGSLLRRIASEVGHNVVRRLHVHGPTAPSWARGPRRVRGRGPRDTYG